MPVRVQPTTYCDAEAGFQLGELTAEGAWDPTPLWFWATWHLLPVRGRYGHGVVAATLAAIECHALGPRAWELQ
jgi:hypothetical protein